MRRMPQLLWRDLLRKAIELELIIACKLDVV